MRQHASGKLCAALILILACLPGAAETGPNERPLHALEAFEKLPLGFEPNQGQADPEVRFLSRGGGYTLSLATGEVVLELAAGGRTAETELRLKWKDANPAARIEAEQELPGKSHYFIGKDPANWRAGIPQFARVRYRELYPGIDLTFYGNQRAVEFDFELAPGADPDRIALRFEGAHDLRIDPETGDLILETAAGAVRQHRPKAYQPAGSTRRLIPARYVLASSDEVRIEVSGYDPERPLVIDPILSYLALVTDGGVRRPRAVAVDAEGNAYLTGLAPSDPGNRDDVFVVKLDPSGSRVLYSAWFGGSAADSGNGIAVDRFGRASIAGWTDSPDFPATPPAFQREPGAGRDAFVARLSADGSALEYSTLLGGKDSDWGQAIVLDASGNAYVTGWTRSADFPATGGSYLAAAQGSWDTFVARLDAASGALVYATHLGGSGADFGRGIAVDEAGNAWVAGDTSSNDFPTASPVQAAKAGPSDVFVAKLNPEGNRLEFSTFLGGSGWEVAAGIAVDFAGNSYIAGSTFSGDFPVTPGAAQTQSGGSADAFVSKFARDGSALIYSTYLGGRNTEWARGIAVGPGGIASLAGDTRSEDLPVRDALQPSFGSTRREQRRFLPAARVGGLHLDPHDPDVLYTGTERGFFKSDDGGERWTPVENGRLDEIPLLSLGASQDAALVLPDAFASQLNASGTEFVHSTYLGGAGADAAVAVATSPEGDAVVAGFTEVYLSAERTRTAFLARIKAPEDDRKALGSPKLTARVLATTVQSPGVFSVYLQYTNTGDGDAKNLRVNQVVLRTLSGSGTVTVASPVLPLVLGGLNIGASTNFLLTMNVPATATRFSVTENVSLQDAAGTSLSFSLAQSFFPGSPTNRPPVAANDTANTTPGTLVAIAVLANDSDPNGDPLSVSAFTQPANGSVTFTGGTARYTPNAGFSGHNQFSYTITDGKGGMASATVSVRVNRPPAVNLSALPSSGDAPLQATLTATASDPEGDLLTYTWEFGDGGMSAGPASVVHTYQAAGTYTAKVTANDGLATAQASATITANPAILLPPDPVTVAPPLDATVATSMVDATAFLYTGSSPIQTGVAPGTIEPRRAAVLRGRVLDRSGAALSAVNITILNHSEFGRTMSRADGRFDLAVNGGGALTVNYQREGFLPSQRQIDVPWQDYAILPDVVLITLDAQVTTVDLSASEPMQVARGSQVADADGTRRATLLFPQGTTAELVMPNGTRQPLSSLRVRATEYTVGPNGPQAMPAELPPTSAYTYAVELSADEALAAGASEVRFSQLVPFYLENFLGFPVGTSVPLGSYDRTRGLWAPEESGWVIQLLSVTTDMANLDTDGDGLADGAAKLADLGITDAERRQLAALYAPGQSLWRVRLPHFTPYDLNWPYPPEGARAPEEDPEKDEPQDCQTEVSGSIIGCQNQTLGEALGVVGTPFALHYQSERGPGHKPSYQVEIPLSGSELPCCDDNGLPLVKRIELEVRVAGLLFRVEFQAEPNQRYTFTWDGKDAYGRTVQGAQRLTVRIGYVWRPRYGGMGPGAIFGNTADRTLTGAGVRARLTLWRTWQNQIGTWDARAVGLGGWTLSAHHTYDPAGQVVYRGDGQRQSARSIGAIVETVAGTGQSFTVPDGGDGIPATEANIAPDGIGVGPDGSFYFSSVSRIRKVTPKGIITTVAGTGNPCAPLSAPCGDGGPARQAQISPVAVAVGPDNSIYFSQDARIRKVGPNGIINTVAGTGTRGFSGDGGTAQLAQISEVFGLAVGPDGSLYIADFHNHRIRRVGPDGKITTVAGVGLIGGSATSSGDGGPATRAGVAFPHGLAVGRDGSLYIAESGGRVRQVTPDGIIRTIAGNGTNGFGGDGGPATEASFRTTSAVAVGADDTVYIIDRGNNRVRWLRPGGVINTLAGTGAFGTSGDNGPALAAAFQNMDRGLAVGPDGAVYVSQHSNNPRIRRISSLGRGVASSGGIAIPAGDGSEVYLFASNGRHLRTVDGVTGALRYEFAYDNAGHPLTIADGDGNVTTVERDGSGRPTAIVGPFGQRTTLALNTDDYLSRVASPAGEATQLAYTAEGLLIGFTTPRGHSSSYTYDVLGLLISGTDPTGAAKTLARVGTNKDYTVTLTSAGRVTTHRTERLSNGDQRLTTTDPAGLQTLVVTGQDGRQTATYPDGTVVSSVFGPDPRWGMHAPLVASQTITMSGGLAQTSTTRRKATLASPGDVLSLRAFSETTTINGRDFTSTYDATTRTFTQTSPAGRRSTAVLDAKGRLVQEQLGDLASRSYSYNARGRLATATEGMGAGSRINRLVYGADGFLASIIDPAGRTLVFTKDAAGRVTELTLADGRTVRFAYDANGNAIGRTPPGRPEYTFGYTERDQVADYTAPAVGAESSQTRYTYGADRRWTLVQRPDGQSVGLQYDAGGRLSLVTLPSGQRSLGYNAAGLLSTLSAPAISLAYAYDGGLPTRTTWTGTVAGSVARTFDNDFRVTALGVNGSAFVPHLYDPDGLPTQVGDLVLTRAAQTGLITGTTLGSFTDAVSYDGFGAPASYIASQGGSAIYSEQYTRDLLGRLTSKAVTTGGATRTFAYTYDLAGRLVEVRKDGVLAAGYTYDDNGNRLSRADALGSVNATYDAQDRLVEYGATTYAYTRNGEIQSKTAGGQTTAYRYDGLGNLAGMTLPDGTQVEYLLDGQGRRVGKRVNGALVQSFLYQDGLRPIAELGGSGAVASRFVYATGASLPDYLVKAGATYRVIGDHLGSPRLVVRVDDGTVAQRLDYDEFGRVLLDTNPGFQPFGFAGGLYDRDIGLVHFGAREYDAETGRWITKDPIGFAGGDSNLYAYVGNDPVNDVDPEGLISTLKGCFMSPAAAAVCAEAGIVTVAAAGAAVAQRGQQVVQAVQRGGATLANYFCRVPTLPGVGNLGPAGPVNLGSASTLPGNLQRASMTVQSIAPQAARQAQAVHDRLATIEGVISQQSQTWQWWFHTVQATRNYRERLPHDQIGRELGRLWDLAMLLFGGH